MNSSKTPLRSLQPDQGVKRPLTMRVQDDETRRIPSFSEMKQQFERTRPFTAREREALSKKHG